jgi:hypothetical protein
VASCGVDGDEVGKLVARCVPLGCVASSWRACQNGPHDGIDRVTRLVTIHCRESEATRAGRIELKRVRQQLSGEAVGPTQSVAGVAASALRDLEGERVGEKRTAPRGFQQSLQAGQPAVLLQQMRNRGVANPGADSVGADDFRPLAKGRSRELPRRRGHRN